MKGGTTKWGTGGTYTTTWKNDAPKTCDGGSIIDDDGTANTLIAIPAK
jgi:hypothetical protein